MCVCVCARARQSTSSIQDEQQTFWTVNEYHTMEISGISYELKLLATTTHVFVICVSLISNDNLLAGTALGYGLDDRGSRVRFLAGTGTFSLHHRIQNNSGAHPASYPMGEVAGAWSWPLTSIYCRGQRMHGAIPPFPQYAFMAWCSVKAQGQLYLTFPSCTRMHCRM